MTVETDLIALKLRVRELEDRLKYLYTHLNITYVESAEAGDAKITEMLKRGNKIEAIKSTGKCSMSALPKPGRQWRAWKHSWACELFKRHTVEIIFST